MGDKAAKRLQHGGWNVPVVTEEVFIRTHTTTDIGMIALVSPGTAVAVLQQLTVELEGAPRAMVSFRPIKGTQHPARREKVLVHSDGGYVHKTCHIYDLAKEKVAREDKLTQLGNGPKLQQLTLELARGATADSWRSGGQEAARKHLRALDMRVVKLRELPEGKGKIGVRWQALVATSKPLCDVSGQDGVIVRPSKRSSGRVVWLDETASHNEALKASKKYKGRLIISPKAYGLTDLPDTSVERTAWRELRGDETRADESTYVLHGLAKKSDPDAMVAAMKEKGMTVRTSRAISAGKTWKVQVTGNGLEEPMCFDDCTVTTTKVAAGHKLHKRSYAEAVTGKTNTKGKQKEKQAAKEAKAEPKDSGTTAHSHTTAEVQELKKENAELRTKVETLTDRLEELMSKVEKVLTASPGSVRNNMGDTPLSSKHDRDSESEHDSDYTAVSEDDEMAEPTPQFRTHKTDKTHRAQAPTSLNEGVLKGDPKGRTSEEIKGAIRGKIGKLFSDRRADRKKALRKQYAQQKKEERQRTDAATPDRNSRTARCIVLEEGGVDEADVAVERDVPERRAVSPTPTKTPTKTPAKTPTKSPSQTPTKSTAKTTQPLESLSSMEDSESEHSDHDAVSGDDEMAEPTPQFRTHKTDKTHRAQAPTSLNEGVLKGDPKGRTSEEIKDAIRGKIGKLFSDRRADRKKALRKQYAQQKEEERQRAAALERTPSPKKKKTKTRSPSPEADYFWMTDEETGERLCCEIVKERHLTGYEWEMESSEASGVEAGEYVPRMYKPQHNTKTRTEAQRQKALRKTEKVAEPLRKPRKEKGSNRRATAAWTPGKMRPPPTPPPNGKKRAQGTASH